MNLLGFVIFVSICVSELNGMRSSNKSDRMENLWMMKNSTNHGTSHQPFQKSTNNSNALLSSSFGIYGRQNNLKRIPQINFYSSISNGLGFIGQAIIWLREISAALGTPIPIWLMTIPCFIIGVGLFFIPNFTNSGLPLSYPNGAGDGDPLAAFPPLLALENLPSLNFIKQAIDKI